MIALPLVSAIMVASSLHYQVDSTARLRGRARSSTNGQPLAGVMIAVPAAGKFVVSDSTGAFWVDGVPAGLQVLRISYEGRWSQEYEFTFRRHHTERIAVLLDLESYDLNPLVVEARQPNTWRDLAGFYERRTWYGGFASFYTREDIERIRPRSLRDLLTLEGVAMHCYEICIPTRFSRGVLCAVPINLNGLPWAEDKYDQIPIGQVAAVEVYRGVPPYGLSVSLAVAPGSSVWMGGGFPETGSCGLVLIWTR